MTKYEFVKLHYPNLIGGIASFSPSALGLPVGNGNNWSDVMSNAEIDEQIAHIVKKGITFREFACIHYPHTFTDRRDIYEEFCVSYLGVDAYTDTCGTKSCERCWNTNMNVADYREAIEEVKRDHTREEANQKKALAENAQDSKHPYGTLHPEHYDFSVKPKPSDALHPNHYEFSKYSPIKVIRAWGLNFNLGNAVKYLIRAGKKDPAAHVQDLEKAIVYIQSEIEDLKEESEGRA